jgi:FkbM family methyltransferase
VTAVRRFFRQSLFHAFASQRRAAAMAFLARPLLRRCCRTRLFPTLWGVVERTVNVHAPRVRATTWFGSVLDCRLGHMIEQQIFYTGVWEPDVSRFFRQWLEPGDQVVDAGANIGYFSLLAAHLVGPGGAVVAVEAWPETAKRLDANLRASGAANVLLRPVAIAASEGSIVLHEGPPGNIGGTGVTASFDGGIRQTVAATRFASILNSVDLARLTLIKIDIEGAEIAALRDLVAVGNRLSPRMAVVVELTPEIFCAAGWELEAVIADFAKLGFQAFRIANDYALTPDWWRFEPRSAARLSTLSEIPAGRFDAVFLRRQAGGDPA